MWPILLLQELITTFCVHAVSILHLAVNIKTSIKTCHCHNRVNLLYLLACLNNVHRELLYYPALVLASASTNVRVFRTSLFPNPMMVHVWYVDGYWSKILHSTIPIPIHDLKVKVTDLELLC